jgi:pimeloyl-ACP methyl ester carboxylesterase
VRERFVEAAGLRTRYLETGSGRAALLLHGASLGSSCDVWAHVMPSLAEHGLRVVAPDLPGFGESDNPEDVSLGFRTRFVPALLDALGIDRAAIVGHSQSGRIALGLAIKDAKRVDRIVVVGTASLLPPLSGAAKSDAGEPEEGGDAEPSLEDTRALLESQLVDRSRVTDEAVQLRHRMSGGKNFAAFRAREAVKPAAKEKDGKPAWQRVDEALAPARFIYGRQDRMAEARAALARERYPALDIHLIDRCGHIVMWDAPTAFVALCGEFLAR